MGDKYTATWVSHSSISDYLACPRAYFLKNVFKDPKTNKKVRIISPALALGQAVHETLEELSSLSTDERFVKPLPERFSRAWEKVSGKRGGFFTEELENIYRSRGEAMIARVYNNPGPIKRLAVKMQQDLPFFWLTEEENIILCGKIDWLEYIPETDSVHIIDFKTGKHKEGEASLQLPMYHLLVVHCQNRKVDRVSYWYLEHDDTLTEQALPDLVEAKANVLTVARKMKLARQLKKFDCPNGIDGCRDCLPMERVIRGEGEFVGRDGFGAGVYVLAQKKDESVPDAVIL